MMNKISGTVAGIEVKEIGNHKKAILTLNGPDKQKCFIEFRDSFRSLLNGLQVRDKVEVDIYFEGKTSKGTGINHNYLIGKSISKNN